MAKKIKAVVIDDMEFCRSYLVNMLEDMDCEVMEFGDAVAFIGHCNAETYCPVDKACADLLLTDNQMPRLTGLEMLEELVAKGCKLQKENRVIFSGRWSDKDLRKAESLGCKTFKKPYLEGFQPWLDKFEADFLKHRIA